MTSLVTGASGFIGSHLARLLLSQGDRVRALVRPRANLKALDGLAIETVEGDLRDARLVECAVRGVNRVFHVAADYRLWANDPREIYETNVTGTRHLLQSARRANVTRFIHTSSVATLAVPRKGSLPDEETQASLHEMIGHYKRSKFLAEHEVLEAAKEGFPAVVVNPTTPVGPGDWKPTPTGQIIVDFLNGKMLAYVDTGMNLVAVEDVAVGHVLAAECGQVGERYILGAKNMTLKEILNALAEFSGRPSPRLRLPHTVTLMAGYADLFFSRLAGRQPRIPLEGVRMARHKMFVNSSKATRALNFHPGSVEAALERAVRWYTENNYVRTNHLCDQERWKAA